MHEMMSGPMILGLNLEVFIMLASGIFYLICASFLWKPFKKEKNELIGALFAFLIYQALSMFFMGLEMETKNILYSNIASISVFIGSVYMLKFPFSFFPKIVSKILFFFENSIFLSISKLNISPCINLESSFSLFNNIRAFSLIILYLSILS